MHNSLIPNAGSTITAVDRTVCARKTPGPEHEGNREMTRKTTVLTLNRVSFLGGVERIIVNAALAARQHGLRPVLACPLPGTLGDAMIENGLEVRHAAIDRGTSNLTPAKLITALRALRRGRADVTQLARAEKAALLHVHHPVGVLYAGRAAAELGLPIIWHVHETRPQTTIYELLCRFIVRQCALIICVSKASREMVLQLGADPGRVRLIYNGVSLNYISQHEPAPEVIGPGPHFGLFGVIEPRKGQDHFLAAGALLAEKLPTAQFWVVGPVSFDENAPYEKRLRQQAAASPLAGRVHFTGYRTDVTRWMTAMQGVVLASTGFESLPTVLIEAGALGKPTVGTDVGGVREIIEDGATGLIVPPADPEALAQAMLRIASPEGPEIGAKARVLVLKRFHPDDFGSKLAEAYQIACLAGKSSRSPAEGIQ